MYANRDYHFEDLLFHYRRMFDETLKRGAVYWPGESIKKFGLQVANIVPVMVAKDVRFQWGEIVVIDSDGNGRKVTTGDAASAYYGVVHRNATATYGVLSEQVMGFAPRLTISVFTGGRDGEIAVPVQTIHEFTSSAMNINDTTAVAAGGQVYVRTDACAYNDKLPVGGIESISSTGNTAWTGVTFTTAAMSPYKDEKYTDQAGPTTMVAGIKL